MATGAQMDRLVGRAMFDREFRRELLADPAKAARRLRYRLDGAQVARIRSLDPNLFEQLGADFERGIERQQQGITFW